MTRVVGLLPTPTSLGGSGAVVSAVGGANIQSVTLRDTAPTLNETNIAFASTLHSPFFEIYVMNASGSTPIRLTNNLGITDGFPAWSPDGRKIAFSSTRDGNKQIFVMRYEGDAPTRLTDNQAFEEHPSWSPFVQMRTLVGTGGAFGAGAAGFLFGQSGDDITSFVAFDTYPYSRSQASITSQALTHPDQPNLIFVVTAPYQLSSLSYANDLSRPPVVVISSSPGPIKVNGALVSFNATTGKVASVLPYTAYRSSGAPVATRKDGVIVERGLFLGAWDADGKNRAHGGASEVHLDTKTGAILLVK